MRREYEIVPPKGATVVRLPESLPEQPLPVYKRPNGDISAIRGRHAESWPFPRQFYSADGSVFVEVPLPSETGWGITYHAVRWPRTPLGTFFRQYAEGRASGFPLWPVLSFALNAAWQHARGR